MLILSIEQAQLNLFLTKEKRALTKFLPGTNFVYCNGGVGSFDKVTKVQLKIFYFFF